MSMIKKTACITLCSLMTAGLAACGEKEVTSTEPVVIETEAPTQPDTQPVTETVEPTEAETAPVEETPVQEEKIDVEETLGIEIQDEKIEALLRKYIEAETSTSFDQLSISPLTVDNNPSHNDTQHTRIVRDEDGNYVSMVTSDKSDIKTFQYVVQDNKKKEHHIERIVNKKDGSVKEKDIPISADRILVSSAKYYYLDYPFTHPKSLFTNFSTFEDFMIEEIEFNKENCVAVSFLRDKTKTFIVFDESTYEYKGVQYEDMVWIYNKPNPVKLPKKSEVIQTDKRETHNAVMQLDLEDSINAGHLTVNSKNKIMVTPSSEFYYDIYDDHGVIANLGIIHMYSKEDRLWKNKKEQEEEEIIVENCETIENRDYICKLIKMQAGKNEYYEIMMIKQGDPAGIVLASKNKEQLLEIASEIDITYFGDESKAYMLPQIADENTKQEIEKN